MKSNGMTISHAQQQFRRKRPRSNHTDAALEYNCDNTQCFEGIESQETDNGRTPIDMYKDAMGARIDPLLHFIPSSTPSLFLLYMLIIWPHNVNAEDDNYNTDDDGAMEYQVSTSTQYPVLNTNTNKGLLQSQDFCNHNYIQVQRISILCDTPGAYYYGSNAYRNSQVCMSGDKAHLTVQCTSLSFWLGE